MSTASGRKFSPSMETDTEYTPGSANLGGLHCSVPLSTYDPEQDRGGLREGGAGSLLLEGCRGAGVVLHMLCLKVNLTMMLGESQKPSPRSSSLLNDRRGPSVGQACSRREGIGLSQTLYAT